MKLSELLINLTDQAITIDSDVSGLHNDSRLLKAGEVFIAYPGDQSDGRDYINQAVAAGASAIIYEPSAQPLNLDIPSIAVKNLREKLGIIASHFYQQPSREFTLIGVTGTNGKTSVCHLLAQALTYLDYKVGVIGTLGNGIYPNLSSAALTTPDALALQKTFFELKSQVDIVVMEVSSHALAQKRIAGSEFDMAIFTNLTQDHLDYHRNFADYANAKASLFKDYNIPTVILNADDPIMKDWQQQAWFEFENLIWFSKSKLADAKSISLLKTAINNRILHLTLNTPLGELDLQTQLQGEFNIANLMAVISVLIMLNTDKTKLTNIIRQLQPVSGRMELLNQVNKPLVIIDYAHTPDALSQVLQTIKAECQGQLICVFGCGGDRDRSKRPQMAQAAEQYADRIIVTRDNPRTEADQQIIDDILAGFAKRVPVEVELERAQAIKQAIQMAEVNDSVLIAGKGHEDYQLIGTQRLSFSDKVCAQTVLDDY